MKYKKILKHAWIPMLGYGLMLAIMWLGGGDFVRGVKMAAAFTFGTIFTFILMAIFVDWEGNHND